MSEPYFFRRIAESSGLPELGTDPGDNPFTTDAYVNAVLKLGWECWAMGIRAGGGVPGAAIGIVRRGRLSATLEIASLPAAAEQDIFWDGVHALSKRLGITDLVAGTFGSPNFEMPRLRGEISRKKRIEYALALDADDFEARLSSNHKKNIRKARAACVTLRRGAEHAEAHADHTRMILHSRERRAARGERILPDLAEVKEQLAYLETGAGEMFQAVHNGQVVASLLVLQSARRAYCQSTGSSAEGMRLGGSAFLFHNVCIELHRRGLREINLGGAEEGSSLAEFKAGFGAAKVPLAECVCYLGPAWLKKLRSAIQLARTDRAQFWKVLSGNRYRMVVYALATNAQVKANPAPAGAHFQQLSARDLMTPAAGKDEAEFRSRQLDRLSRFGDGHAYGVFARGQLAHVSWLLPSSAVNLESPKFLTLQEGEAEITGSETLAGFRGRGLYAFAIQQIFHAAQNSGVRKIYMKTRKENLSSQTGIRKAGLRQTGEVTVFTPPAISSKTIILRKFRTGRRNLE